MPRRGLRLDIAAESAVDFRPIDLSPASDGRVVDRQAASRHEFLDIAETEREPEVPANAGHDHVGLKLPLLEDLWTAWRHLVKLGDSKMQHFLCVAFQHMLAAP